MRRFFFYGFVLMLSLSLASPAFAQGSATLVGQVVDQQGAVVPNATVTATNTATGGVYTGKSTSSGNYTIPNLPPGNYEVKFEAASFAPAQAKGVKLNVGDQRPVNVTLAAAGKAEVVEVTAEAPLIETTKTEVSTAVTDLDMERLPTFQGAGGVANDYAQLALTAPGVRVDTSGVTGDLVGPGSISSRGNLYNVDGANITDQLVTGRDGLGASVDEVQEFQVVTNNYNAEYGQAGGLIINAVTKSGTNGVHGDGHLYLRGRNFRAANPFDAFTFVDPTTGLVTDKRCPHVGTSDIDGCPRLPYHRKEGGFTIGGPFVKNHLFWFGSYELSQQAVPQVITPPAFLGGAVTVPEPVNNLLWSGKVDYKINDKNTLSARMWADRSFFDNLVVQTGNNITPDSLTTDNIHVVGGNVGFVSSLTSNLVNEARVAYIRTLSSLPDKTTKPGQQGPGFYTGAAFCCPQGGLNKRYQYIDNLTWTHGAHTFKMGGNISYYPWFSLFQQFHFGQYTVTAADTPTAFTFAIGPGQVTSKDNIYGGYFQDTWKLGRHLTLNAGIRYDVEAGAFKGGKIHGPNGTCFQGNGIIPACSSDYNNWQPRLGFTFEPWQGTLFKASFAEVTQLAFNNVVLDSLNFDGTSLNTITTADPLVLGAFPNAPNPALLVGAAACPPQCGRVRPISDHLHNPEMRMFNFGIQHEFTKTLTAEIQYIGQFGFGLFGERDTNAPVIKADPAHPGFFYYQNQPKVNAAGPLTARPDNRFLAIRTNENSRTSHYNGLLVSATKRFSNHIQFNASYTWSHALTSGEDFFGLSEPGDPRNIRAELGPAFNDIRHQANFGVVLDSGKVTGAPVVRWFTNDLGLSWVGQLQGGRPYPISTGSAGFGSSERFFGTGNETQQRPSVLADGTLTTFGIASFDKSNALFGPGAPAACVAMGAPAAQCATIQNTFLAPADANAKSSRDALTGDTVDFQLLNGNLGRDAGRSSPFYRFDVSLKKTFKVPHVEHLSLELRADAINVFNYSNWQSFNSNDSLNNLTFATDSTFFTCTNCMRPNGTVVGTDGRVLHLADVQRGKISPNLFNPIFGAFGGSIGDPATADFSRQFQFSFHVRF